METAAGARAGAQPSVIICDALCLGAALWTLCCHAVVTYEGSLHDLLVATAVALAASLAAGALLWRRRSLATASQAPVAPAVDTRPSADFPPLVRAVGGLAGIASLAAYFQLDDALVLWWASAATLLLGVAATARTCPQPPPQERGLGGPWREAALWALGLSCVFIPLKFHCFDLDTPFYVSLAVAAADTPSAPLMLDTIHGVDGLGLHMPAHRIHSFEVWNGALSYLSGWPAITCYLLVTAAVAAFLTPLAFARLFRILTPRHWLWATLAVIAVLVGGGGTLWWYGNYSIARIFHGKSVYMSIFLPLIYAYGLRFGAAPSAGRWVRLCAAQIAALGCTSSALWSAPIAGGLAVACAVRLDRKALRALVLGGLASAYLVGVGLVLRGDLAGVAPGAQPDAVLGARLDDALGRTLGGGALEFVALAAAVLTWTLYRRGPAQRFATLVPFAIVALLLNPYWAEQVSRNLTGPSYWRALWAFPIPILMALLLTAPLQLNGRRAARIAGGLVAAAAIFSFVLLVPAHSSLSEKNRVFAGRFPKIVIPWGNIYRVARALSETAPAGSMVVAPQKVALWVISFHHHPDVSYARETYLRRLRAERGDEEVELRMLMSDLVSYAPVDIEKRIRTTEGFERRAATPGLMRMFREGLGSLDVRGVCLNQRAPLAARVRRVLQTAGFEPEGELYGYEIWLRTFATATSGDPAVGAHAQRR